jgi:chromosome partitioning protein
MVDVSRETSDGGIGSATVLGTMSDLPANDGQQPDTANHDPLASDVQQSSDAEHPDAVKTYGWQESPVVSAAEAADAAEKRAQQQATVPQPVVEDEANEPTGRDVANDNDVIPDQPARSHEAASPTEPEPDRPRFDLPRVIAVANQKGGVGKTTSTINIAACLAEQGYRTLLVDLDPQANASTGVGLEPREMEHSIYHVLLHDQDADSCIEPTEVKNLFVLPSSLDLAGAEIELVSLLSREHRLRMAIESVIEDYDYVLIDCPPSLGLLTINALTAAHEVLVPIQCEYYALEGLGQLMRNIELVRASLNPKLEISHIVLVMFDPRTKLAGQVVDEVRTHFGPLVCDNVIPRTVRLSEAPSFGQPITVFDSSSRGASAYRAVTLEVIDGQA